VATLAHRAQYIGFRFLLVLLSRLSSRGTIRLGRFLGVLTFDWIRLRRRVALENLSHAFPEWTPERRLSVARECYRQFGITFLELCRLPRMKREEIQRRVRFSDPEMLETARREGHGAVLLTGHFGNWEMMGSAVALRGYPTWVLVRPMRNRLVDTHVTAAREGGGMRVLPIDGGLRPILRALRGNGFVAFLADQDAGRDGLFVPFLGRPASTPVGPARFARAAGAPIIVGYGVRQAGGDYRLELHGPLRVRKDLPAEEAEREATRQTVQLLEEVIRTHPEQWFWMHRRWKTRPPGEREAATEPAVPVESADRAGS